MEYSESAFEGKGDQHWHPGNVIRIHWIEDPAPTFIPFGRLPGELRRKIWKLALPEPRALSLYLNIKENKLGFRLLEGNDLRTDDFTFGNSQLLACYKSRQVFLESYCKLQVDRGILLPQGVLSLWISSRQ